MSDDNKNTDPFDFDFNALNEDEPQAQSDSSFDLDSPFGDDIVVSKSEPAASQAASDSGFDLDNPFGDDLVVTRSEATESSAGSDSGFDLDSSFGDDFVSSSNESGVSADNPYINDSSVILPSADPHAFIDSTGESVQEEQADSKKKKGLLSGILGGKKGKATKEKASKEKPVKEKQPKPKKEKKEKTPGEPAVPRDWGTILCIAFSVFWLASLLIFNVATFLSRGEGSTLMGTLCFLGAFNLVGLALAAVPILFYKFPQERTLPNVMLGVSTGAIFTGVLFHVCNAYHYYGFAVTP